jgi:U3 small nucleolar RNA-associated protein 21
MAFDGDFVLASSGPHVLKYSRGKEVCAVSSTQRALSPSLRKVGRLTNPLGTLITSPLVFGSHILALTEDGRNLLTWDVSEQGEHMSRTIGLKAAMNACEELHSQIHFEPGFIAVRLFHPATYLNKVLVGGNDGSLQLWNIRTRCVPPCIY